VTSLALVHYSFARVLVLGFAPVRFQILARVVAAAACSRVAARADSSAAYQPGPFAEPRICELVVRLGRKLDYRCHSRWYWGQRRSQYSKGSMERHDRLAQTAAAGCFCCRGSRCHWRFEIVE
jgi:hypothetical protein